MSLWNGMISRAVIDLFEQEIFYRANSAQTYHAFLGRVWEQPCIGTRVGIIGQLVGGLVVLLLLV